MSAVGSPKEATGNSPASPGKKSSSSKGGSSKGGSPKSNSPGGLNPGQLAPGATAPGEHTHIEIDTDEDESTYTPSTLASSTESLRSSILRYKWEHGRRYHAYKDGAAVSILLTFPLIQPNDEKQQDAEALQHEMYRNVLGGKLFLSPIPDDAQSIIDLGCGAGSWCIDVADELPSAEVIGIDLSPIQPPFVPPNCRFEIDDMTQDWTFPENKFDLVFIRSTPGCIENLPAFFARVKRHLKPGGWVEHVQASGRVQSDDGTVKPDSASAEWYNIFKEIGDKTGKSFGTSEEAPDAMRAGGFAEVRENNIKLPIGTWPRDPTLKQWGAWNRMFLLQAIEGFSIRALTTMLGWPYEKAQVYLLQLRKELVDPNIHAYFYFRVAYAQKEEVAGPAA